MRTVLFVEGGSAPALPRRQSALTEIWGQIAEVLGFEGFCRVVPISKKHLVAMDPRNPPMSGAGEGLDKLMARMLNTGPAFDAAVVAWDLVPEWNADGDFCRWRETLNLYRKNTIAD